MRSLYYHNKYVILAKKTADIDIVTFVLFIVVEMLTRNHLMFSISEKDTVVTKWLIDKL